MSSISKVSLEDTLTVLHLVRETALAQGREAQFKELTPVMEKMQEIVYNSRKSQEAVPPSLGLMGQDDFRTLLEISKGKPQTSSISGQASLNSVLERNRLVQAMAGADMSDVEIARQFGMTREEVRLVLSTQQKSSSSGEVVNR